MPARDLLYELAASEQVSTPTPKPPANNGASLVGRLKCWWTKRHPAWMYLQAVDSGRVARICERCGRLQHGERVGDKVYFPR
jgi:hypothetical protein